MKRILIITGVIVWCLGIIGFVIPAVFTFSGVVPLFKSYSYVTSDGKEEILGCPQKGHDYSYVQWCFKEYKKKTNQTDLKLYRTCKPNYLVYWCWVDVFTHLRWDLEYREKPKSTE